MDMLISLIVVIIWQCVHMSKHHVVCLEYVQFLFVSYIHLKKAGKQCWIKFKKEAVWTAPAQSGHQPHGADIRGWRRGILTWLGLQTAPRKPEQERRQTAAMIWAEKPRLWANVKCCLRTKINARGYSQGAEGPRIGGRSESQTWWLFHLRLPWSGKTWVRPAKVSQSQTISLIHPSPQDASPFFFYLSI